MCYFAYLSQSTSKQSQLWAAIPIVLFTLVFGMRYGVGIDYNNYMDIYEETTYDSYQELLDVRNLEYGFAFLIYLCHYFQAPVYVLFTICAFIQIFLLYKTFKEEGDVLIYIYATLILTGFCMYNFMNIIRHDIAFCFFLYSLRYIRDNKPVKYWLCCILALGFHLSALILFPIYFIWIKRKSYFNRPWLEVLFVLASFAGSFVVQWRDIMHKFDKLIVLLGYENYLEAADHLLVSSQIGYTRILILLATLLIVLYSKRIKEYFNSDVFNMIYDMFLVGTCLGYIFMGSMMMGRMIVYFSHTQFIVWAYALSYLHKTKKQSVMQLASHAFIVLSVFILFVHFIYQCEHSTGAYVSYFQTDLHQLKDNLRYEMMATRE